MDVVDPRTAGGRLHRNRYACGKSLRVIAGLAGMASRGRWVRWAPRPGLLRRRPGLVGRRAADRPQALLPLVHRQGARPPDDRTTRRPTHASPSPRDGHLQALLDLIASGRKTTEIRVNDSSRRKITEGSLIWFRCRDEEVLTHVTRVARYTSFEEMFDHESVASVNPTATREDQLANIRQIYPRARGPRRGDYRHRAR